LLYDLRHAVRALSRRPAVTIVAVLTLALGIGGATAIFSVADAVLLRPLPYADPDRLVIIWQSDRTRNQPFVEISYPAFREWRDRTVLFESIAAMPSVNSDMALTGRGEPTAVQGRAVTGKFFALLGTAPALGRVLLPQDEQPDAPAVAVLSHGLWRDRFNAAPDIAGDAMILDGRPHTIVGVMPAGFEYPEGARFWIPLQLSTEGRENAGVMWLLALGRMKPGVRIESARTELTGLWRQMHARFAPAGADLTLLDAYGAVLTPLRDAIFGPTRPALLAIFSAGVLVLLIACSNVAGLLLVQTMERRREMAVRYAIGASRARLVRPVLAESMVIALLAGAGGLAAALVAIPLIIALSPAEVPRLDDATIDARAFGFVLLASTLATIVSALAPIVVVGRAALDDMVRDATPRVAHGGGRIRAILVIVEVAVAVILVIGAGLLVRSFTNLRRAPLGFEAGPVLSVMVSPTGDRYAATAPVRAFYQRLLERVHALPGVTSASAVTRRPLWSTVGYDWTFTVEGQSEHDAGRNPLVNLMAVSADYFRTMGIAVKRGRVFTSRDADGQPGVVVVSESLAARAWPGLDPIGKRVRMPLAGTTYHDAWLTVVGVVGDARYRELQATRPDLYMSYLQSDHPVNNLMVRTDGDPAALTNAVVQAVHSIDPNVPVIETTTMARVVHETLGGSRFAARLFGAFALVALTLAALGVYALLAYWVTSRTREIGVRMALGARPADVRRLIFRHAFGLAAVGLTAGVIAAAVGARFIAALLYDVSVRDPVTFAAAPLVLAGVVALACLLPAVRATRVDPACALRAE
jgi:putative ABC transport system permease protein